MLTSVFAVAERRLFKDMSPEEKQDEIKSIYRERRKKLRVQAQGKNFVHINAKSLLEARKDGLQQKYQMMSVRSV